VSEENEMAKFKDEDEIQPETPSPRSPADQRRDNEDQLAEYIETHEKAGKENRGE
jgi:hypothetical protein